MLRRVRIVHGKDVLDETRDLFFVHVKGVCFEGETKACNAFKEFILVNVPVVDRVVVDVRSYVGVPLATHVARRELWRDRLDDWGDETREVRGGPVEKLRVARVLQSDIFRHSLDLQVVDP